MEFEDFMGEVEDELNEAEVKHPEWPEDPIHASAILNEEAGELTQATIDYVYGHKPAPEMIEKMEKEALQVGAMAARFVLNLHTYKTKKEMQNG